MKVLSSLSITARLALSFGALGLLVVATAGAGWWQQRAAAEALHEVASGDLEKMRLVDAWAALSREATVRIMAVNKSADPAIAQMFGPEIGPQVKEVGEMFKKIRDISTTPDELAWFEQMNPLRARLLGSLAKMGDLRKAGDLPGAGAEFDNGFVPAQKAYNDHIGKFALIKRALLDQRIQGLQEEAQRRSTLLLVLGLLLGAAGIALAVGVTTRIRHGMTAAVDVARAVADGDLTRTPVVEGSDEFARLMGSMADMTRSLERIVSQVRQGTEGMATASSEIAHGNADLSRRTERQGASVQEASAAMQAITESVRQNADSARQASELAQEASTVAQRGGEAVSQMVSTMGEIDAASRRIEEIIGVIDGISFQTNILALNAAVEAARAGEQGRGFAVVATEVRSLAHRSAQAAREIKGLITNSTDKVQLGSQQVQGAGRTMQEIVASVARVSALVSEISVATAHQNRGIAEIGSSVTEIDQMTQQNAALVEQAAAASESMKQQAGDLAQAVAVFKTGGR